MNSPGSTLPSTAVAGKQGGRTRHFHGRPVPSDTMKKPSSPLPASVYE